MREGKECSLLGMKEEPSIETPPPFPKEWEGVFMSPEEWAKVSKAHEIRFNEFLKVSHAIFDATAESWRKLNSKRSFPTSTS